MCTDIFICINQIQGSLVALMSNLNETQKDLSEAHEAVEEKDTLQDLQEQIKIGKVGINYETGELSGANFSSSVLGGLSGTSEHIAAAVSKIQQEADPAVLHLDVNLLEDIVLLSVATALGGMCIHKQKSVVTVWTAGKVCPPLMLMSLPSFFIYLQALQLR